MPPNRSYKRRQQRPTNRSPVLTIDGADTTQDCEISVNITADKTAQFIDYLRASLSANKWTSGSSYAEAGGGYTHVLDCTLTIPDYGDLPVSWKVTFDGNGVLARLSVFTHEAAPPQWESVARRIVFDALMAAYNDKKLNYFFRHQIAHVGHALDGEYYINFTGRFRVAPATHSESWADEKITFLDHNVTAVDGLQARNLAINRANQIVSLLSVFLDVGFYSIRQMPVWVLSGDGSQLLRRGYIHPDPEPDRCHFDAPWRYSLVLFVGVAIR